MDELLTDNVAALATAGAASFRRKASLQEHLSEAGELVRSLKEQAKSDPGQTKRREQAAKLRAAEERVMKMGDGGFPSHEQIDAAARKTTVYAPVPEPKTHKDEQGTPVPQDKHEPKPGDSPAVAEWRKRMASEEAAEIYKQRAATAECVNAQARNRGLLRMPVRGLVKMKSVVGLFVLAHNLLRTTVLAPQLIGWGTSPSAAGARPA